MTPLLKKVIEVYGPNCFYCGTSEDITIDHVTPLSAGGKDAIENLAPACVACNSAKAGYNCTLPTFQQKVDNIRNHVRKIRANNDAQVKAVAGYVSPVPDIAASAPQIPTNIFKVIIDHDVELEAMAACSQIMLKVVPSAGARSRVARYLFDRYADHS